MAELLLLCQFLLLVAGWFLYLKAQRELRDSVRRHSVAAESEQLRHTVDELLSKLVREAERAKRELDARIGSVGGASGMSQGPVGTAAVYRLAENGRSATEIARELARPVGEIELLLGLRESDAEKAA
jgi:hypothetical protein